MLVGQFKMDKLAKTDVLKYLDRSMLDIKLSDICFGFPADFIRILLVLNTAHYFWIPIYSVYKVLSGNYTAQEFYQSILTMRYYQWLYDHYIIVNLIGQFDLVAKTNHSKIKSCLEFVQFVDIEQIKEHELNFFTYCF